MDTVTHLRAPEGCPWDRKQTHASLRTYLMEETYEALEALDQEDPERIREELGDILLQIALHSVIANEAGMFNISDVIAGIDRKIISRHPHVFGDVIVHGEKDVLTNWDKLKREEKGENGISPETGMLDGVPSILPALSQAQALQQRAARVGFDWPEITPVLEKVFEELEELKSAPGKPQQAEEFGDLLFALVNLVRWYEVDAESSLRQANQKFRSRFAYIERRAREMGREMTEMSLAEMDELWEEAKDREPKNS
jgi:tetrapyrrole methylase family protein/MazG family protein